MKTVSGETSIYAILGDPIRHSMSPVLMNRSFGRHGLDKVFLALPAKVDDFDEVFTVLRRLGFAGYVFTMPVKEIALGHMDALTTEAEIIGAINCAVSVDGRLVGSNTDSIGFWQAVQSANTSRTAIRKLFVLGCGGFAKAAVAQAAIQGVEEIVVATKFEEQAFVDSFRRFQDRMSQHVPDVRITLVDWIPAVWEKHLGSCDLIANGTPNGMGDKGDLHAIFPYSSVKEDSLFFDAIYYPRETKFLKSAKEQGHICVAGLDLLVHQGVVSYETFTGKTADPAVMMDDVLEFIRKA